MKALSARFATGLALLCGLLAATQTQGADMASADAAVGFTHLGVSSCAQSTCHGATTPWLTSPIAQNEYFTWRDHDPHSGAFRVLGGDKARGIATQLGLKDATQAPLCLGCHADNVPVAQRGIHFKLEDGITCETCHGGAQKWIGVHNLPETDLSTLGDKGLYPTVQVQARAQLCSGCHELGRHGADHRLISAGHPQFPENLAAYLEKWPKHYTVNAGYVARKHPPAPELLNGRITLLQASDWAEALAHSTADPHGLMPEFSFFQCDNCHRSTHEADAHSTGQPRLNDAAVRRLIDSNVIVDRSRRQELQGRLNALNAAVLHGDRQEYGNAAAALYQSLKTAVAAADAGR